MFLWIICLRPIKFRRSFEVDIQDHQDEKDVRPAVSQGSLVWYTDGSVMCGNAEIGIYGAMGNTPTVFPAVIYAIDICSRIRVKLNIEGQIPPVCQSATKALSFGSFKFQLVLK